MVKKSVRIVNETGLPNDFKVFDAETGEPIHRVRAINFSAHVDGLPVAEISCFLPEVDVTLEALITEDDGTELNRILAENERLKIMVHELIGACEQIAATGNGLGRLNAAAKNAQFILTHFVR